MRIVALIVLLLNVAGWIWLAYDLNREFREEFDEIVPPEFDESVHADEPAALESTSVQP